MKTNFLSTAILIASEAFHQKLDKGDITSPYANESDTFEREEALQLIDDVKSVLEEEKILFIKNKLNF